MKLSLAFSPCPNDTFIFDAMIHQKIDTYGIQYDCHFADVEALNQAAFQTQYDITKLSYHAFAYVAENYQLLNSGSALGNNCGPLLIAKTPISFEKVPECKIAIPGKYTTANLLLSLAFPTAKEKEELIFSEIENAVVAGEVDCGLIIHENRFTYQDKGVHKIIDLGEFWESNYKVPIPLGGIAVKRNLPKDLKEKIDDTLKRSVQYAFDHPNESMDFVKQHAQEMDVAVMKQHIELYVNDFSVDLGNTGRAAINNLYMNATEHQIINALPKEIFI